MGWQDRGLDREQRIGRQLGDTTSDENDTDAGRQRDYQDPSEPRTRPITIQLLLMPSGYQVWSRILPNKGLPTIATRAPIPATNARLIEACLIPTASAFGSHQQ